VVTATGILLTNVPEGYRRVGAFLVLHVYGPTNPGSAHGPELAGRKQEGHVWKDSLGVYGSAGDPWTIKAPVDLRAGNPVSCEVGIERVQPFFFLGAPG
jgi:hypothetical protein